MKTLIISPTYNEKENISKLLDKIMVPVISLVDFTSHPLISKYNKIDFINIDLEGSNY